MSFVTGTVTEQLYSMPAAVTKNTYTTQAAYTGVLGTNTVCTIPAGLLLNTVPNPVGRAFNLKVAGTIATTAAATFANAININATAGSATGNIVIYTATAPTASVTAQWMLEVWLTCTAFATSTFTLQCNGRWVQEVVASGAALQSSQWSAGFAGTFTGLDPRVVQYVELFGTWSASAGGNTTTVQQMQLFGTC